MAYEIKDSDLDRFYPDPQQEEDVPVFHCAECKEPIYEGEDYWNLDEPFCDDCAKKLFRYEAVRKE